jgi:DNA polymerase
MSAEDDPRAELASVAASLRAYLEWQEDTGATGIPRAPRKQAPAAAPAPPEAAASPRPPDAPTTSFVSAPVTAPVMSAPVVALSPDPAPQATTPIPSSTPPAQLSRDARLARLAVIGTEVASCTKCDLSATRTNTVYFRGNPEAALCFIGEAPGADEDAQGLPFVGRAGQLLDKMISAMGLVPERDVYVCNIIKCRPPDNRKPTPEETATCIPYLHEQLALVRPKVIVALGNTAASALLDTKLGISKLRGQWKLYKGTTLVMPTYHPSYLLRPSPQQVEAKKQAWEDLQAVMKELKLPMPAKK